LASSTSALRRKAFRSSEVPIPAIERSQGISADRWTQGRARPVWCFRDVDHRQDLSCRPGVERLLRAGRENPSSRRDRRRTTSPFRSKTMGVPTFVRKRVFFSAAEETSGYPWPPVRSDLPSAEVGEPDRGALALGGLARQ
jgi:hypothetical protein